MCQGRSTKLWAIRLLSMQMSLVAAFRSTSHTSKPCIDSNSQVHAHRLSTTFGPTSLYLAQLGRGDAPEPSIEESTPAPAACASTADATITAALTMNARGIYEIETQDQHSALLEAHPNKLIVIKFFADHCQACKVLAPKYLAVKNDKQLGGLPIVWAEYKSTRVNKDFFRALGVISLPTVHFYDGSRGLVENFPCGPTRIPLLKKKLATFLNNRVDPDTLKLKEVVETAPASRLADVPRRDRAVSSIEAYNIITEEHLQHLKSLAFFENLSDVEFDEMLKKARLQTFLPGDVIVRQGELRHVFYVIKTGQIEMSIKSRFEDPIHTPPNYLGAVVNELGEFDFFGERACTTGEPYAASFKVLEKTRCFAFNAEDIPESSILSIKRLATREIVEKLDERYELPDDYEPPFPVTSTKQDADILELLVRFKQIRQVAKGFEYVMKTKPIFGDEGEIARRSLLVDKLSKAQRDEFISVFRLADTNNDNRLSMEGMRRFMESARAAKTDEELTSMISKARVYDPLKGGEIDSMTLNEFLGVMAESEFYNLLTETFQTLDSQSTGYVRAGDLNGVLGGVRDIVGVKHKTIIDSEDENVRVDIEQFTKMLLGIAL
eukprot:CAMPEP_0181046284 /NCGR_PEP_ID=MMETSP1070-20121207/14263_1 /TAXON_ID=265543 /ORGANISM="Minutocellus polymorphus, Strain NH13" /LENGTH=607 /DNA_ID=CAMNT_0023124877 /DNA_START=96 /DNA_END=1919 /DNA_ORIENTATION=-